MLWFTLIYFITLLEVFLLVILKIESKRNYN
ncbi:Putative protein [Zobellia galactanivorans]|uniref:Uncharacterized protein n=1 Tax=Zobellia galactanivorans (strain DSM 12802 / CCUG 47099 / CIP 106680 / NCIMB 13871 / Dsij) TaxID=63186 RepID=G0L7A1_ZOBGA|nr:Putative protein [Zobellia galactanivorans]